MSYQVNNQVNPYNQQQQQLAMGLNTPISTEKIQQHVQNASTTVQESDNIVTQTAKKDNKGLVFGLGAAYWFVISKIMDVFNKKCADQPNSKKNLIQKTRDLGDNIGKHFKGKFFTKISNTTSKIKGVVKKLVSKSAILDAMVNNPAKPKMPMAIMMKGGTLNETAIDVKEMVEAFVKNADGKTFNNKNLKILGITEEQFVKINKNPSNYIDDLIEACKKGSKHCNKNKLDDFIQLADVNTGAAPKLKNLFKNKVLGKKVYNFLFGRKVYWTEGINKLEALKGLKGNAPGKTALGKSLPKAMLRTVEGLTNGTAGGKFAIMMQAYVFADATIRAIKAEKGDKGKTFIESIVNDLSYYLLIPTGMGILYGLGGLKYIGMNENQIKEYRTALEAFNKQAASAGFASKAEYKDAAKPLKDMLKGSTKRSKTDGIGKNILKSLKNLVYKPLKTVGKGVSVGLEAKQGYVAKGSGKLAKSFKNIGYNLKRGAGIPTRFMLYTMLITPPLVKLATKACHLIFGKPKHSILDEDKEAKQAEKQQSMPALVYPAETEQQTTQIQQPQSVIQPEQIGLPLQSIDNNLKLAYSQNGNVINNSRNMIADEKPERRRYIPSSDGIVNNNNNSLVNMYQKNPSTLNKMLPDEEPTKRRYIPSSDGVQINSNRNENTEEMEKALRKANRTEKVVNQYLK